MKTWTFLIAVILAALLVVAPHAWAGRQGGFSASNHVVVQSRGFGVPGQSVFVQRRIFVTRPFVANGRVFVVRRQIIVTPFFFVSPFSPFVPVAALTAPSFGMIQPFP